MHVKRSHVLFPRLPRSAFSACGPGGVRSVEAGGRDEAPRELGLSSDLGTLEPGKLADLIVVDGDPLEDLSALRNVELVVEGR